MRLKDLKAGDVIVADEGFTCVKPGNHLVRADNKGSLFIYCDEGTHYLDGAEAVPGGELVGFTTMMEGDDAAS